MTNPIPLEELLGGRSLSRIPNDLRNYPTAVAREMARRLRALEEEIEEVEKMEFGHGIQHPFIFTNRLRIILEGQNE